MNRKRASHLGADQTDALFYANDVRHEPGASSRGCFTQWGMTLTREGAMISRLNGHEIEVRRGDLIITAPGVNFWWQVPFQSEPESGWCGAWMVFHPRPHWYAWLHFPEVAPGVTHFHLDGTPLFGVLDGLMQEANRLYRGGSPDREAWAMLALERALLTLHEDREQALDERVQQALEYLNRHYASPLTLETIARACHVSVSYLSTLFQMEVGTTPIEILEQIRMQRAQELLKLSFASINEVAAATGYRSASYFIHRFKKHSGRTPRAFRKAANYGEGNKGR